MKTKTQIGFLAVVALLGIHAHAQEVDYVDFNAGTWAVDPAYSSAPTNPGAPAADYTTIAPRKNQGVQITCFAAKPGGGIDVIYNYSGFQVQTTTRTEQYKAFAHNYQPTGNQEAFWGAKVGGGVDYLYYDPYGAGNVHKYDPASNLTGTYNALVPSSAGTHILSSYAARAGGGIDFLYYDDVLDTAVAQDTGLNPGTVYQALSLNTAAGGYPAGGDFNNPLAVWGAKVGGGVDIMFYNGTWNNIPLADNLADRNYIALAGADGSGLDQGCYAARADGGIDLIYLVGDGSEANPWQAVTYNVTPIVPGKNYTAIAMDRRGLVPGDFFALGAAAAPVETKITNVAKLGNGSFQIDGSGGPGLTYYLQATSDLASPLSWVPVTSTVADGGGLFQFVDPEAVNHTKRFYSVYK